MKILFLALLFLSTTLLHAHDIALVTQHVAVKRQSESAWQQDILGRAVLNRVLDVGLQATYLERFEQYENRYGGFLIYHPTTNLTLEGRYLHGDQDNEILPRDEFDMSAYYSVAKGLTPFLVFRDARYSVTDLSTLDLGLEIEKIPHLIIIPKVMFGSATFKAPAQTKNVHNLALRVMYYKEKSYSLFVYGSAGKEAAQGIVGDAGPRSSVLVDTLTGGIGAGRFLLPNLRAELLVDHTDYDELNNQFLTTTLHLRWIF